ncbi:unnamed protein product [Ambrosiozyma monospora]|uniref:Unnamed protein product n=1 Tax=Ambrosiozyma monospora TaxID=43982 RepID=A0A9W6YZ47_AMBMO|nr:unnamed protein product [Ambrosiozyma monospora]
MHAIHTTDNNRHVQWMSNVQCPYTKLGKLRGLIRHTYYVAAGDNLTPCTLKTLKTDGTIAVQAYADDLCLYLRDEQELPKAFGIIEDFARVSGLSINKQKSILHCHSNLITGLQHFVMSDPSFSSIPIKPIDDNTTYLGMPLLKFDWTAKFDHLKKRVTKILFNDLPLTQRVVAINTYIFSTIYFFDQHDPAPDEEIEDFVDFIKKSLSKFLPINVTHRRLQKLWNIPVNKGGLGLLDLKKQVLGRRATYIYELIASPIHL